MKTYNVKYICCYGYNDTYRTRANSKEEAVEKCAKEFGGYFKKVIDVIEF